MLTPGQIIYIKCPNDGKKLAVKYFQGIENHTVTCPACHKRMAFTQFKIVTPPSADEGDTLYPGGGKATTDGEDTTGTAKSSSQHLGTLRRKDTQQRYTLQEGRNVVGRQAQSSSATIQLAMGADRHMSREHLLIEVKHEPKTGYVHTASLCREQCNATRINGQLLYYGDKIVLNDGDAIDLPGGVTLLFDLPDEENDTSF